jgi:hypothetical protein
MAVDIQPSSAAPVPDPAATFHEKKVRQFKSLWLPFKDDKKLRPRWESAMTLCIGSLEATRRASSRAQLFRKSV